MNDKYIFSDFELDVQAAMAMPDAAPHFVTELRNRLTVEAEDITSHRKPNVNLKLAWGIPLILLAILTMTTLLIGPQKVWAAVRNFFGYIPGVGYVQTDSSILVLEEAVMVEREGIQVSVEQVVADAERTVVLYKAEGLSLQAANSQGEGAATGSIEMLRLPDGTELSRTSGGGSGWGIGYSSRMVFPALPDGVDEIVLVISRLQSMPPGVAPENWEIPLKLVVAEGEVTLLLVEEVTQPNLSDQYPTEDIPANPENEDPIGFNLARVVELNDGFQFEGTVNWLGDSDIYLEFFNEIQVLDANGERVPSQRASLDELFATRAQNQIGWAQRTVRKSQPGPWTLNLSQVILREYLNIPFRIDLGENPRVGQTWEVDYTFEAQGITFTLKSVTLEQTDDQEYRLVYAFDGGNRLYGAAISDQAVQYLNGSGGSKKADQDIVMFVSYNTRPTGVRQLTLESISYLYDGSWQISWQPPAPAAGAPEAPSQASDACMTIETWDQLKAQPPALPDEVIGKLLLLKHTGQMLPDIILTALDGSQSQTYGIGAWISLSPDGSTIVVPEDADGIHLIDTATGENTLIPGTLGAGYPIWSPDGSQIAFFVWDQASIYRVNLDGTDRTKVYQGSDIVYLSDWTADGNKIMYLGFGEGGMVVRAINVENGLVETWIQTANNKPSSRPQISPDGEWVIYIDQVAGDVVKGIYALKIDGSEKKLLISGDNQYLGLGLGVWSPDGQWLALNVRDLRGNYDNPIPVLVNPVTCEVVPLFSLSGEAVGWGE